MVESTLVEIASIRRLQEPADEVLCWVRCGQLTFPSWSSARKLGGPDRLVERSIRRGYYRLDGHGSQVYLGD